MMQTLCENISWRRMNIIKCDAHRNTNTRKPQNKQFSYISKIYHNESHHIYKSRIFRNIFNEVYDVYECCDYTT